MHIVRWLYKRLRGLKAAVFFLGLCGFVVAATISGVPWYAVPLCAFCAVVYVVLPGKLLLRLLPKKLNLEHMKPAVTLLLGLLYLCVAYVPAARWQPWLLHVLVLPLAAVSLVVQLRVVRGSKVEFSSYLRAVPPDVWNLLALLGGLLAVCGLALCLPNALPSAVGPNTVHQDILWNVGNAASLKSSFPPWDFRFMGIRLQYHFFTDLLAAIFSMLSGLSSFEVHLGGLQPLMLCGLVVCLRSLGMVAFDGSRGKSLLLALLLFTASSGGLWWTNAGGNDPFGNIHIYHIVTNMNGQTSTALLCAVFLGLYLPAVRKDRGAFGVHCLLCLAAFGLLCLTKGPEAGIVACALVLVGMYCLIGKRRNLRAALLSLGLAALFVLSFFLLYSGGANSSMYYEIRGTLGQSIFSRYAPINGEAHAWQWLLLFAQWLLVMPLLLFGAVCSFVRDLRQNGLLGLAPGRLLCYAVGAGGLLAFGIFTHNSYSQVYFLFIAIFFWCLPTVDTLSFYAARAGRNKLMSGVIGILMAATFVTAGAGYARLAGNGLRILYKHSIAPVAEPYTPSNEAAALWLRDNTPRGTVFATNRIHSGEGYKGISNFFSALSERQAYMEGFEYVRTNMGISFEMLADHVETNAMFFDAGSDPAAILERARVLGISYIVYCEDSEGSREQLARFELVYEGEGTAVFRLY